VVDEGVDEGLKVSHGGGLRGLGAEPFLHRLLEAFDFSAGGGVVRSRVFLSDAEAAQF
jgi:hypothetical protein